MHLLRPFSQDPPLLRRAALAASSSMAGAARRVLWVGCALAAALGWLAGDPTAVLEADAPLARLLRGMAALKLAIVLGAALLVHWRLGSPTTRAQRAFLIAGCSLMSAAMAAVWQLSHLVPASIAFHSAGLALLLTALRDRR